jgi:hypothetical protein
MEELMDLLLLCSKLAVATATIGVASLREKAPDHPEG